MMNISLFKKAIFIREFESLLLRLFDLGRLNGTVHTCIGQEYTPTVILDKIKDGDKIFSHHRGHGHFLASKNDPKGLLAELLGKKTGVSGGIGGSQHLIHENFISNGIQGGLTAPAVGYSFSRKLKNYDNISFCFIGDGTLGQGLLYESLNIASMLRTPTLFILEDNKIAQSTPTSETIFGSIENRVKGFGVEYREFESIDLFDNYEIIQEIIGSIRSDKRPVFLHIHSSRLKSHSKGDDNRDPELIKELQEQDPINQLKINSPEIYGEIVNESTALLENILHECAKMEDLDGINEESFLSVINSDFTRATSTTPPERTNEKIYHALKEILSGDDTVFIGEDIRNFSPGTTKAYGGAFKVSRDLSDHYSERVINFPISEQAIVGFGIGSALDKRKAICEIMFGDFMTLCVDQILQQASKIPSMFGKEIDLPLVIRTPMGGRRGYGPTHSQSLERLFLFHKNIHVVAPNNLVDIKALYNRIISNVKRPTIIIEDKISYTKFSPLEAPKGYEIFHSNDEYPTTICKPKQLEPNCIIILYGGMVDEVLQIIDQLVINDIMPLLIIPTSLSHTNIKPIINSLKLTKNLLFIEEGSKHNGFSSAIIGKLSEMKIQFNLCKRISNENIIPCSKTAEREIVPNSDLILKEILKIELEEK